MKLKIPKPDFRPSRRQVILMIVFYVVGAVSLNRIRIVDDVASEIAFHVVLFCLTFLFLFAAGGLAEAEEK